jgi:ribosome-associated protein
MTNEVGRRDRETGSERSLMPTIPLRGEHITLGQAVKAAGLADSGGQAKRLVRGGTVTVNREVETRPGRKLRAGDCFGVMGGPEWVVGGESEMEGPSADAAGA